MAIMWNGSLVPWLDPSAAPYSGARAYFFDAGTTTPQTIYRDSDLGQSHDHPVLANASGQFPPIFFEPGSYRLRIEDGTGVTIWDVDGISVPSIGDDSGGGGGDTPVELLARTGDFKFRHSTGSHSGWVRANGRTIGSGGSGATERANADCEALFLLLWQDTTLTVVGGRGGNAASDWSASKQITLPDLRLRGLIGMASMGAGLSTLIAAATFDNSENGDTLGATVGAGTVTLTEAQMPVHDHDATSAQAGAHRHGYDRPQAGSGGIEAGAGRDLAAPGNTDTAGAHSHNITVQNAGGGQAHPNVQPSAVATCYIKL